MAAPSSWERQTTLIGKLPALALGDKHTCPMCMDPVPHVGGPIMLGSTGVFFGKKSAARISDQGICVRLCVAVSPVLKVHDNVEIVLTGDGGKTRKQTPYTLTLHYGSVLTGKLDGQEKPKHRVSDSIVNFDRPFSEDQMHQTQKAYGRTE